MYYRELEQLFQRVYISNIPKKYEDNVNFFIKFFKNAKKLIDLLDKFYHKGYPENFDDILIEFKNKKINCKHGKKNYADIGSLINHFESLYKTVSDNLNKCYYFNGIMRFFYGRQLLYIYDNIINENFIKILELLNANFGINLKKYTLKNVDLSLIKNKNIEKYNGILKLLYRFIISQFDYNKISPKDILTKNKILINEFLMLKEEEKNVQNLDDFIKEKYKGIYFYTSRKNQEIEALNLYISITNNFPVNILII